MGAKNGEGGYGEGGVYRKATRYRGRGYTTAKQGRKDTLDISYISMDRNSKRIWGGALLAFFLLIPRHVALSCDTLALVRPALCVVLCSLLEILLQLVYTNKNVPFIPCLSPPPPLSPLYPSFRPFSRFPCPSSSSRSPLPLSFAHRCPFLPF